MVKLSKLNGVKKAMEEGERREMITPALRQALTKQGEEHLRLKTQAADLSHFCGLTAKSVLMTTQYNAFPGSSSY